MASGLVNPQWAKLRGAAERGGVALHFRGQGMFSFSAKALFQGEGKNMLVPECTLWKPHRFQRGSSQHIVSRLETTLSAPHSPTQIVCFPNTDSQQVTIVHRKGSF